jgi:mannose-6-phosphate isomerase
VAEIQQASDTTWRLHDWGRVGADGQPRKLHVAEALAAIDYMATDVRRQMPQPTDKPHARRLVACDKFVLDRWTLSGRDTLGGGDRFHLVSVIDGELLLGTAGESLQRGETVLLPASLGPTAVKPRGRCVLLDMYLP